MSGLIHRVRSSLTPWVVTVFTAVGVGVFSLTIASGRPFWPALVYTLGATVIVLVGTVSFADRLHRRWFKVAVHAALGLCMSSIASLSMILLFAEGVLASSIQTLFLGGLLIVGLLLIGSGGLLGVSATRLLRRVARIGLVVTVGWALTSLLLVIWITLRSNGLVLQFNEEAVALWALFLALVGLPALVFRQDLREIPSDR
ncbi:hypothetical protein [Haloarchaeobius sp. HRN-SO-5]|uniref:hypothetical protein n=1 Tax=Haloarchaeobius sp. HRN-SO-5 TaxID=3446118 RepID=UPI003EB8F1CD